MNKEIIEKLVEVGKKIAQIGLNEHDMDFSKKLGIPEEEMTFKTGFLYGLARCCDVVKAELGHEDTIDEAWAKLRGEIVNDITEI